MTAGGAGDRPQHLATAELRIVAGAAVRLLWWWPGIVVVVAAYVVVAGALFHQLYPNLWGGLAAGIVALAWYASPMRTIETRRRDRLRSSRQG